MMISDTIIEFDNFFYGLYLNKSGIDGWCHIRQTVHFGTMIAAGENPDLIIPVVLGCYLHDIGRGREQAGQSHGEAGYDYCVQNRTIFSKKLKQHGISDVLFEQILYAVQNHDKGITTENVLCGCVWDADRLSLARFKNKVILKKKLSTRTAQMLIDYAYLYVKNKTEGV